MKKAVISGATGVVGRALLDSLLAAGTQVLVVLHRSSERLAALPRSPLVCVRFWDEDIGSYLSCTKDGAYESFFHLAWAGSYGAARENAALQKENLRLSEKAVLLAKQLGCRVFIGAGSQAEYGCVPVGVPLQETIPCYPESAYGAAKLAVMEQTRALCAQRGIRHVWARLFSVYGPHDRAKTLIMTAIAACLAGESAPFTRGEQRWDYLYSEDAARALVLLAQKGEDAEVYNVASGTSRTLAEYISSIHTALACKATPRLGELAYRSGQPMNLAADITKLQQGTGFCPEISFEQGVLRTARWCAEEMDSKRKD